MEDEFIKRDIFNTNQNVSNIGNQNSRDILESRYTTQLGLSNLNTSMLNSSNETQKEILQNRYDNSLQTNTLQAQMQNCCCELKTAIHAEGEATRAQMQNDKIEELRASLNTTSNAYNNVSLANNIIQALQPTPKPAYMVSSPYAAYPPYLMAGTTYGTTV
jgi:phosphoribosylformylglycinamidine (FGAM) synthase-like enzyme